MALPIWITVTPEKPVYTEDDNQIQFSYAQNTTPNTRATSIRFFNAIAEEKHEYNPGSPNGEVEFFVYQFGRRELKITASSDDSTTPGVAACNPVTYFADEWDTPGYTGDVTANIDYTACSASAPGCFMDRNREGQFRCYTGENNNTTIGYNISLTVSSTSPWLISGGDFWTGVDPAYYIAGKTGFDAGDTNYAAPRTWSYGSNPVDTPVTVNISISGNDVASDRSTVLYLINKQGYVNRITINQKKLVFINGHPAAGITSVPVAACPGTGGTIDGSASYDPEGDGLSYDWGGIASGSGVTGTFTYPTGGCQTAGSGNATLVVTDSLGDVSSEADADIVSLPLGANDCISTACTISCPSMANGDFTCNVTLTNTANSCPVTLSSGSYNGLSRSGFQPSFNPADFGNPASVVINAEITTDNGNGTPKVATCSSNSIQFATPIDPNANTIIWSGDGQQSASSGNVSATCQVVDPNDPTDFPMGFPTYSMTGNCNGVSASSSSDSLSIPFSGLDPGDSQTCEAECTYNNGLLPDVVVNTPTTSINRPLLWECQANGCAQSSSGTFVSQSACESSCTSWRCMGTDIPCVEGLGNGGFSSQSACHNGSNCGALTMTCRLGCCASRTVSVGDSVHFNNPSFCLNSQHGSASMFCDASSGSFTVSNLQHSGCTAPPGGFNLGPPTANTSGSGFGVRMHGTHILGGGTCDSVSVDYTHSSGATGTLSQSGLNIRQGSNTFGVDPDCNQLTCWSFTRPC